MKINELKPINGSILVVDELKETKTDSGIFIPENARNSNNVVGGVIAVSSEKLKNGITISPEVSVGDIVMYTFTAGAGNSFKKDGKTYRIVKSIELLAILN